MNVRSAILKDLATGHKSLDDLLKLNYLDRRITRTLTRMIRHKRIEEYEGVYALKGQLVKTNIVTHATTIDLESKAVVDQLTEAVDNNKIDREALLGVLDNSVKDIVPVMKTLSKEEILILKEAEIAGKTRKSLMAAIKKQLED